MRQMPPFVYWARHGTSYANVVSVVAREKNAAAYDRALARLRQAGPGELTPLGVIQARAAGRRLRRSDIQLIVCSCMPRAIETAVAMRRGMGRPELTIYVAPLIHEVGSVSRSFEDVLRLTRGIENVSLDLYRDSLVHVPSMRHFMMVLPRIVTRGTTLVVSHGNLLQYFSGDRVVYNTEVFRTDCHGEGLRFLHRPAMPQNTHTLDGPMVRRALERQGLLT